MADQPERSEPKLARTDFESMTHEELAALIDAASSEGASQLASRLTKAASTITKIGDDLMTHVKGLEWQGKGGDAFRDWGGQAASATLRLGQYAEGASRWMETVAQAVAEAKAAMPKVSETTQAQADLSDAKSTIAAAKQPGARNDPDARALAQTAQSDATAAQGRIDAARAEAIQQMQKLAQTYEYSAQQVNSMAPPTFSPPADHMDRKQWDQSEHVAISSPEASRTTTVPSASLHSAGGSTVHAGSTHASGAVPTTSVTGTERISTPRPASMEIDGTATLPQTTTPTGATPTEPRTAIPRPEVTTSQPGVVPPLFGGTGGGQAANPPARVPSGMRSPMVPGQGITNGSTARMPRETGIVGGRPVSPTAGRPAGGIPRGTVIGGGNGTQGRTPMMRGMTPGTLGGGSSGGQGAMTSGRRLASETGGVVGGRSAQPGRTGTRGFTPGGSGLVRPAQSAESTHGATTGRTGTTPGSGHASAKNRDEQQGRRPDYLVEEEETWSPNHRRALPPVVD
ncbi:hypothetical protein [Streptomyces sp. NBC_00582]|uniref:hypothetical protein n=1 Tax=Streptomyces sp. NBC_00582 TaxID=2975783 RepID=UPI002E81DB92|nr:hypothetical protein [Streptomyces sp. NBC_00582]WUB61579.1 hypothetical protein OG852_14855 [Streptomyces sp. NBC_00582]